MKKLLGGLATASILAMGIGVGVTINTNEPIETNAVRLEKATELKFNVGECITGDLHIYGFDRNNGDAVTLGDWPGASTSAVGGVVTFTVPANTTHVIVNNNGGKQTVDIDVYDIVDAVYTLDGTVDGSGHFQGSWNYKKGYYMIGMSSWELDVSDYQDSGEYEDLGQWRGVYLEEDTNFKTVYFEDGYKYNNSWKGYSDVRIESSAYSDLSEGASDNIVVGRTGYYNIYLNREGKLTVNDAVQEWIDTYMHMGDYDSSLNVGAEGNKYCLDDGVHNYYSVAKENLLKLDPAIVAKFSENDGSRYSNALARYNAWASANQDSTPFSEAAGSKMTAPLNKDNNSLAWVVTAVSSVTVLAGAGLLIARKRKESK